MDTESTIAIERHPWPPFIPAGARVLMLGTFPPKPERWSMDFFYPNRINDMWRVMGMIYHGDRNHYWDESHQCFRLDAIQRLLTREGIALWDTAMAVRRLRDNASDKFLPRIGQPVQCAVNGHAFALWRMPSTSRAYPLSLERKADAYRALLRPND